MTKPIYHKQHLSYPTESVPILVTKIQRATMNLRTRKATKTLPERAYLKYKNSTYKLIYFPERGDSDFGEPSFEVSCFLLASPQVAAASCTSSSDFCRGSIKL